MTGFKYKDKDATPAERGIDEINSGIYAFALEPLFAAMPSARDLCDQLTALLANVWTPHWLKAPAKKRKVPTPRTPIRGNQTSVYRLLNLYNKQRVNNLS